MACDRDVTENIMKRVSSSFEISTVFVKFKRNCSTFYIHGLRIDYYQIFSEAFIKTKSSTIINLTHLHNLNVFQISL